MKIDFNEETHTYAINGDIASCSVTELLHKHGLAPNYSGVNKTALKESAEKGKQIHKEFENVVNQAKFKPQTAFGKQFSKWVKENLQCGIAEQVVGIDFHGLLICGTADLFAFNKSGERIVLDHKPKGTPKEYVAWQTSLLDYMAKKFEGVEINGKPFAWGEAKHFYVNYYDKKNETIEVVELEKIPDAEIEKLLRAEFNNEIYQKPELIIDIDMAEILEEAEEELAKKKAEYDEIKAKVDTLRSDLMNSFIGQGIKRWETPNGKYCYSMIEPTITVSVDATKLKKEYPEIYLKCTKEISKKGYLRLTANDEE